jgi:glutamate synthase domain-containing protein 2
LFEIVGLARRGGGRSVLPRHASRIRAPVSPIWRPIRQIWRASLEAPQADPSQGGLLKYVHGGEYHTYNPDVVQTLQAAVRSGDYADYKEYADTVNERPVAACATCLRS